MFASTTSLAYGLKETLLATNNSGQIGELQEGDKIILGSDNNDEVVWDVGVKNSNDYVLITSNYISSAPACSSNTENSRVYISGPYYYMDHCKYITTSPGKSNSPIYDVIADYDQSFSNEIDAHNVEKNLLITQTNGNKYAFIPTASEVTSGGRLNVKRGDQVLVVGSDVERKKRYFVIGIGIAPTGGAPAQLLTIVGPTDDLFYEDYPSKLYSDWIVRTYAVSDLSSTAFNEFNIRAFAQMHRNSDLVFAVDAAIHDNQLHKIGKTTIQGDLSVDGAKKLRIFDSSIATPNINGLYNSKHLSLVNDKVAKGSEIEIQYNAIYGGNKHLSLLCEDALGNFVYYKD